MNRKNCIYIFILLSLLISGNVWAQSLSLNQQGLTEYYRRQQLLGTVDSTVSFTLRPLYSAALQRDNIYDPDGSLKNNNGKEYSGGIFNFHNNRGRLQLLPASFLGQFNTHHPEGINDGLMIPSRGYQFLLDAGLHFKYSLLEIKFNPEFVFGQNKEFEGFPAGYKTLYDIEYPSNPYRGRIDLPENLGGSPYRNTTLGQSSVRLNYKAISAGISNENLWWGPGYRNSLLMTNSASGFKHLTLNTIRPIKTFIGTLEGQIIGGRLEDSGYTEGLTDDWRYLNSMVLTYGPKWVPGLFLGFSRSFMVYSEDMGSTFDDYLPVLSFLSKKSSVSGGNQSEADSKRRNQNISLFMRWMFQEANGEIYFEYGREDHAWDNRDFIQEPAHSAAYIVGIRKLFVSKRNPERYIQFIGELTHLASSRTTINRNVGVYGDPDKPKTYGGWYLHTPVRHGYTHEGQMLGAGIGPTSNMQTIHVSWNEGLKQIGLEFDRYVHNNDFWHTNIKDIRANWVDLSTSFFANWDYKHFLLYGKMKFVSSKNYQWLYEPPIADVQADYWTHTDNTFNLHMQLGVSYRF